jgi:glycosyltransferase involved in cell wall biosynthesis
MHHSVVICTYNPRMDYLAQVLTALRNQTLPVGQWELLLIDNASTEELLSRVDLSWHPNARIIRENQLGLTAARLRGIKESKSHLLVFVDDDNVLDKDYLEAAGKISHQYDFLGSWGGQIRGQFEVPPPEWTRKFWPKLAISDFATDSWSNLTSTIETTPSGAGMCVRRQVAELYYRTAISNKIKLQLGRTGNSLTSCEDTDIAWTSYDLGLGTGRFTSLKLKHLIPKSRLEEQYLLRLTESMAYSSMILYSSRGRPYTDPTRSELRKWMGKIRRRLIMKPRDLRFFEAKLRGEERAFKDLVAAGICLPAPTPLNHFPAKVED